MRILRVSQRAKLRLAPPATPTSCYTRVATYFWVQSSPPAPRRLAAFRQCLGHDGTDWVAQKAEERYCYRRCITKTRDPISDSTAASRPCETQTPATRVEIFSENCAS